MRSITSGAYQQDFDPACDLALSGSSNAATTSEVAGT
jgi:hypothetical protein